MIQEDGIQRLVRLLRSSLVSIAAQREAASALAQLSMHRAWPDARRAPSCVPALTRLSQLPYPPQRMA